MTGTGAWRSNCPLSMALDIVGDRWSLLVVRDMLFRGGKSFCDFQGAEEHIASNILSDRLNRLAAHGIIEARPDPLDARRKSYRLTQKGKELAPVMVEMVLWSARHHATGAPKDVLEAMASNRDGYLSSLQVGGENAAGSRTGRSKKGGDRK